MSDNGDDGQQGRKPYEVGYGKPPVHSRFQPGRSGNVSGGSRKKTDIDAIGILSEPVPVRRKGKTRSMDMREVGLHQLAKKAQGGDRASLFHIINELLRYGALGKPQPVDAGSGVFHAPSTMPWRMVEILADRHGALFWTPAQVASAREEYIGERDEDTAQIDAAIGYPDLIEGDIS
ncbi:MAG: DUF5681 domain-containing protein [Sphingobium sp.]